jgi:cysteine synthase A
MATEQARTTNGQGRRYDSIVDTIGNTPCIRINTLAPQNVTIYVKAEFFNPAASVKDRLAISIIEEAERNGTLKPGQTVVEATSGNTGIGLALPITHKMRHVSWLGAGRNHRAVQFVAGTHANEFREPLP